MHELPDTKASTVDDALLRVDCYAGHRSDSEPRRLHFGVLYDSGRRVDPTSAPQAAEGGGMRPS